MRSAGPNRALAVLIGFAASVAAAQALAQNGLGDNQAGMALRPHDAAAQPWALEHQGRTLCHVRLEDRPAAADTFRVAIGPECGGNLPAGVTAWRPVNDGAVFLDAGGRVLLHFDRWSNSLLVASRQSGFDVQLRRGA
ncbi:MAG TPA: AprI/Inh family metalloprotease inhibitor [Caulobacteraceae bacterium]|nr:AprI/Inh family metalloprotease inhibitor [Caulobacteraceae bacterium]